MAKGTTGSIAVFEDYCCDDYLRFTRRDNRGSVDGNILTRCHLPPHAPLIISSILPPQVLSTKPPSNFASLVSSLFVFH